MIEPSLVSGTPQPASPRRLSGNTRLIISAVILLAVGMFLMLLCVFTGVVYLYVADGETAVTPTPTPTADPTHAALLATLESLAVLTPTLTPTPVLFYPASCADIHQQNPEAPDGEYTLYYGAVAERPFPIYCHNMTTSTPAEYLTLPTAGAAANYSLISYPEGAIITHYGKVRINPSSLMIDRFDRTFAVNGGEVPGYFPLAPDENYPVTAVDYAYAESCNRGETAAPGQANLTLTGTPFVLSEVVTFTVLGGTAQEPQIQVSEDRQTVQLTINGRCALIRPADQLVLRYVAP